MMLLIVAEVSKQLVIWWWSSLSAWSSRLVTLDSQSVSQAICLSSSSLSFSHLETVFSFVLIRTMNTHNPCVCWLRGERRIEEPKREERRCVLYRKRQSPRCRRWIPLSLACRDIKASLWESLLSLLIYIVLRECCLSLQTSKFYGFRDLRLHSQKKISKTFRMCPTS